MHPSTALATVLVDELVRGGVREAVLAPGSRSAPLAYALEEADRAGRLRLHVRVDERSAGFLALGMAKASGAPVVVVTTSGTAVANLHPAVLEAHHGGVPLVVVSADRPAELRGTGANQTTVQPGIFGGSVRWSVDLPAPEVVTGAAGAQWRSTVCRALTAACDRTSSDGWVRSGPVHLNISLRDPLAPELVALDVAGAQEAAGSDEKAGAAGGLPDALPAELAGRPGGRSWTTVRPEGVYVWEPERTDRGRAVVLLGDLGQPHLHDVAANWAEICGYPVLAEPFGRLPHGQTVVPHGVLVAGDEAMLDELAPERVVVVGRLTLFRELGRLLRRPGVVVEHISAQPSWTDPSHVVHEVRSIRTFSTLSEPAEEGWAQRWIDAGRVWSARVREAAGLPGGQVDGPSEGPPEGQETDPAEGQAGPLTGVAVASTVAAALADEDVLVLGSSNAPRDLAVGLGAVEQVGSPVVLANRGLAGIDGTVSTAVGIALVGHRGGYVVDDETAARQRTVALMGDLTFLHDVNGLLIGPTEPRPDPGLTIVVVNDDGGGIFSTLEYGEPARSATEAAAAATERIFGTPHGTDLAAVCRAYGARHTRAGSLAHLAGLLAERGDGIHVVEVPVDRAGHRALRDRLRA